MPATPDDLFAFLDGLGIAHNSVTHPPLFTVDTEPDAARAIRRHTKNLFLTGQEGHGGFCGSRPRRRASDLKTLHHKLGRTASRSARPRCWKNARRITGAVSRSA